MMEVMIHEEVVENHVNTIRSYGDTMHEEEYVAGGNVGVGSLSPLTAVALILSFSTLYLQWNRYAASRDAAEYAARIKNQQKRHEADLRKDEDDKVDNDARDDEYESIDNSMSEQEEERQLDTDKSEGGDDNDNDNEEKAEEEDFEIIDLPAEVEKDITENYSKSLKKNGLDSTEDTTENSSSTSTANSNSNSNSNSRSNQWRCACEGGFLPPGMLSSLGGAEAVFRLGTGQCYHKQT